jgi:hypothetical protein
MAQIIADVVRDTTTTTGTGTKTLANVAPLHHQTLAEAGAVTGDTVYLRIAHATLDEWEIANYTYNSTGPTVTRIGAPLASSNAGAAVDFSAGTKNVFHVMPADAQGIAAEVTPLVGAPLGTDTTIIMRGAQRVPYEVTLAELATFFGGSPAPSRPAVMTVGQWGVVGITGGLAIDIDEAPAGSPTSYDYSINNGVDWALLPDGAALGVRNITGLAATERQVRVRAVNAVGPALDPGSDTKTATPLAGGGVAYLGQQVFTGVNTIVTTIPAGVTATDRVFAVIAGGDHGEDTTALATYAGPSGWTPEDSATASTNGTRLFSAPGNVANLTFSATNMRSVTLIGVRGTRRTSAMASRYWGAGDTLHTTPSAVAVAGDLVVSVYLQQDGAAPTFGAPTTDYSPAFTIVDAAPYVRIATRSGVPAGATGALSLGGGLDYSTRVVLTLVVQP